MNCIVIGAGNAGRPVARILNYIDHQVLLIDQKKLEEFPKKTQKILNQMEKEGVELNLGPNSTPEFKYFDSAYISPTIPEDSLIRKSLTLNGVKLIDHRDISYIINEIINIDIIGVTGTLGKTSTTHIISQIFESGGYKVWKCSSRHGNLLSEVIINGIIKDYHKKNDIAIFELPHGTSRLMSQVKLKIGVLTNIYKDHLDEFEGSIEKYAQRKLFIADSSETLISTPKCKEYLKPLRDDVIYYCTRKTKKVNECECDVSGFLKNQRIQIDYELNNIHSMIVSNFNLMGYYFENSIAAAAVALTYGLNDNIIKQGLIEFKGIPGHLEYMGNYCGREIHFDAAFVPEGLVSTLEEFSKSELIVLIDNPDTTTIRDKYEIGNAVGEYADIVISSGYNETTGLVDMNAAHEVLRGIDNSNCIKIAVKDMITAGELAIKNSKPGDTILHVGPGAITNYDELKQKMKSGLENGCRKL
ncbi:MAG: Mur ligase family protein [Methanobacterium sp.]